MTTLQVSATQDMSTETILREVVPTAQLIMGGAMMADGVHFSASMREAGAAAKYITTSKNTYHENLIVQGTIDALSHRKDGHKEKVDIETLNIDAVMKKVDEIVPMLDSAGVHGTQTKTFLYGLAEAVVNASGSGFLGTGAKITEGEMKFLSDLKAHLQV
ncbi:MAG: hypothetical protein SA339_11125 [Methanomassiliicoccus sp.]|nr:hypothetical protein [Methanomassiliicoccus sp.]